MYILRVYGANGTQNKRSTRTHKHTRIHTYINAGSGRERYTSIISSSSGTTSNIGLGSHSFPFSRPGSTACCVEPKGTANIFFGVSIQVHSWIHATLNSNKINIYLSIYLNSSCLASDKQNTWCLSFDQASIHNRLVDGRRLLSCAICCYCRRKYM